MTADAGLKEAIQALAAVMKANAVLEDAHNGVACAAYAHVYHECARRLRALLEDQNSTTGEPAQDEAWEYAPVDETGDRWAPRSMEGAVAAAACNPVGGTDTFGDPLPGITHIERRRVLRGPWEPVPSADLPVADALSLPGPQGETP